jgi:hypothetical protein
MGRSGLRRMPLDCHRSQAGLGGSPPGQRVIVTSTLQNPGRRRERKGEKAFRVCRPWEQPSVEQQTKSDETRSIHAYNAPSPFIEAANRQRRSSDLGEVTLNDGLQNQTEFSLLTHWWILQFVQNVPFLRKIESLVAKPALIKRRLTYPFSTLAPTRLGTSPIALQQPPPSSRTAGGQSSRSRRRC